MAIGRVGSRFGPIREQLCNRCDRQDSHLRSFDDLAGFALPMTHYVQSL